MDGRTPGFCPQRPRGTVEGSRGARAASPRPTRRERPASWPPRRATSRIARGRVVAGDGRERASTLSRFFPRTPSAGHWAEAPKSHRRGKRMTVCRREKAHGTNDVDLVTPRRQRSHRDLRACAAWGRGIRDEKDYFIERNTFLHHSRTNSRLPIGCMGSRTAIVTVVSSCTALSSSQITTWPPPS